MTVIDGINVAIAKCNNCESSEWWIFKGMGGEGYKIACAKCGAEDRELLMDLNLPYLWRHKEAK